MEILIERTYFPDGTNGDLHVNGSLRCHSIELPWHNNAHGVSCIPEGRYKLKKHISEHLGDVLEVMNVPERDSILIHAANNALKELKGCIAPVTTLDGPGLGSKSKLQLTDIVNEAYADLAKGIDCFVTLRKKA